VRSRPLLGSLILLCLIWGPPLPLAAQTPPPAWNPVPPEELALTDNPAQPGAHAMILYREVHTDDAKAFENVYFRIKIFTDEGKKHADIEIPYVEKQLTIENIRARTVRPDGTSIEFQSAVFDRVVAKSKKVRVLVKAFTLPEVQAGSIIEYAYTIRWKRESLDFLKGPLPFFLGVATIPTATWVLPHELHTRKAKFSIRPVVRNRLQWSARLPTGQSSPVDGPDGTVVMEAQNVPGFQEEEYAPPEDSLKGRVEFYYLIGFVASVEGFWSQYGRQRSTGVEAFIGDSKMVKREVAALVSPSDSPEAKLRKMYARAQKIRYISYEPFRTEKEEKKEKLEDNKNVDDVLKRGYGYANEINYLFAAMARAAGYSAQIVYVTARNSQFFERNRLNTAQLNAIVVAVRVDAETWYFDPATRFCPYRFLPWAESDTSGVRIEPTGGILVDTPSMKSSDAITERKAQLRLQDDGSLKGRLQLIFHGQEALSRRLEIYDEDEAGRRKELEDQVKRWLPAGAVVENVTVAHLLDSERPLRVECDVTIPNLTVGTQRRLLVSPAVFHSTRRNPFEYARRVHPLYFGFPFEEADEITIELPKGYRVEFTPRARSEDLEAVSFEAKSEADSSQVRFERRLVVRSAYFSVPSYSGLRAFYSRVRLADAEFMVLQRVETAQKD
jgi:transglutaminase-like putative cysteine protease